jgi:hypothetical protein
VSLKNWEFLILLFQVRIKKLVSAEVLPSLSTQTVLPRNTASIQAS